MTTIVPAPSTRYVMAELPVKAAEQKRKANVVGGSLPFFSDSRSLSEVVKDQETIIMKKKLVKPEQNFRFTPLEKGNIMEEPAACPADYQQFYEFPKDLKLPSKPFVKESLNAYKLLVSGFDRPDHSLLDMQQRFRKHNPLENKDHSADCTGIPDLLKNWKDPYK